MNLHLAIFPSYNYIKNKLKQLIKILNLRHLNMYKYLKSCIKK